MTISQVIFHIKILTNNNKTIKRADIKFSENVFFFTHQLHRNNKLSKIFKIIIGIIRARYCY